MMRAISDIVDDCSLGSEFGAHPVVQRVEVVLGKETGAPRRIGWLRRTRNYPASFSRRIAFAAFASSESGPAYPCSRRHD